MTDLVIRGGTVVTAAGSRPADVAVDGGRITAIEPDLSGPAAAADEVVDATGLLVLPGAVDVHTHTRVATDEHPDRFFVDSMAAAFGGTTSFLSFNNPGTGSSPAAERSLLTGVREWRAVTDGDSAIDYGLSLVVSGRCDDPLGELPATIEAGVATSKAFMVFDFRLPDQRLFDAMGVMAEHGGMLQVHCEDPVLLDSAVAAALQRGDVSPRYHATTRPSYVEAVATARALAFSRMADAPDPRRPPLVGGGARGGPAREGGRRPRLGRDVPALPGPHRRALRRPRSRLVRPLRHRATAPHTGRPRRAVGGSRRRLDRHRRHGPRSRPTRHREGRGGRRRPVQPDQQRLPRHRDTVGDPVQRGRRQRSDHPRADGRPPGDDTRGSVRPRPERGARDRSRRRHRPLRPGRQADDPGRRPPPLERLHRVRGPRDLGRRPRRVRPRPRRHPGRTFVGRRGAGAYVERVRPTG